MGGPRRHLRPLWTPIDTLHVILDTLRIPLDTPRMARYALIRA